MDGHYIRRSRLPPCFQEVVCPAYRRMQESNSRFHPGTRPNSEMSLNWRLMMHAGESPKRAEHLLRPGSEPNAILCGEATVTLPSTPTASPLRQYISRSVVPSDSAIPIAAAAGPRERSCSVVSSYSPDRTRGSEIFPIRVFPENRLQQR